MTTLDIRGASLSLADPPITTNPNADLAWKAPARVATTGANINLQTIGLGTIDGVALVAGDRVLVKDQTDQTTNGLYNATTGPWTRTIDANNNSQWAQGLQVFITQGTANGNTAFFVSTTSPIILGTSLITFAPDPPLGNMPAKTIKGNATSSTAAPTNLTGDTVEQMLLFTQTGTGTVQRSADSKFKDILNAADFGAKGDGVTDDAVAINAAITAANALTPGGRVQLNPGIFSVGSTLIMRSNVEFVGGGLGATMIKLKNAVNSDVIDGLNVYSLTGTGSSSGISFFRIADMTIDGNSSNQTSNSAGIAIYGRRFILERLRIQNCLTHGLRTEFGALNNSVIPIEANFSGIVIDTVGNHGWLFNGPTNSNADWVMIIDAGQAADNTWDGINIANPLGGGGGAANLQGRNLHPYHRASATNRMRYAINDAGGGSNISDSNFEGANIPVLINSAKNTYVNNSFYAAWNGTTLIVKQSENLIQGFLDGPGAGRPATVGVVLGQGSDNAATNIIDLVQSAQNLGAVDFTHSAGSNRIRINGFQTTGPGYIGTPAATDNVELDVSGATSLGHLMQKPVPQSTQSPTNVSTASYTVLTTDASLICSGSGTITLTLPAPASYPGRWLYVVTKVNQAVVSGSSNVEPLAGGAAGTGILAGTAGKWASLQSDGALWQIMAAN